MVNNDTEPSLEEKGVKWLLPLENIWEGWGTPALRSRRPCFPILQVCNNNKKGANILVLHKWIKFIVELCTWVLKQQVCYLLDGLHAQAVKKLQMFLLYDYTAF